MIIKSKKNLRFIFGMALLVHLVFISSIWSIQINNIKQESFRDFKKDTLNDVQSMARKLESYNEIMYGLRGFFSASSYVSKEDWDLYTQSLQAIERYPGVNALGYNQLVPLDKENEFIDELKKEYVDFPEILASLEIFPKKTYGNYFPLKYVVPFNPKIKLIGFDPTSEETRLNAINKSIESGTANASSPIQLIIEPSESANYVVFLPIFRNYSDIATPTKRFENVTGTISLGLDLKDLIDSLLNDYDEDKGINLEIWDITGGKSINIYKKQNFELSSWIEDTEKFVFANREWEVKFFANEYYGTNSIIVRNTNVFFGLVLIVGVISLLAAYRIFAIRLDILSRGKLGDI